MTALDFKTTIIVKFRAITAPGFKTHVGTGIESHVVSHSDGISPVSVTAASGLCLVENVVC